MGIGVNVSAAPVGPEGAPLPPVCLADLSGRQVSREDLLVHLLSEFDGLYRALQDGHPEGILAAFSALDITKGRAVTLSGPGGAVTGRAEGMDEAGRILITTEGTLRAFAAGDVTVSLGAVDEPHS
jgi:BirA family biotin operon repressor/biotin-[acetyl-CoA-carboxylase] ligase